MESQLASARVLLMVAVVPIAVFLCLRTAGVDVGLALGGGPSMPSSDTQVVADFTAPATSADDLFDRRAGTRASVALGGFALDQGTKSGGGKGSSGGKASGSGGGGGGTTAATTAEPIPHRRRPVSFSRSRTRSSRSPTPRARARSSMTSREPSKERSTT
jgi:hypothetical protein